MLRFSPENRKSAWISALLLLSLIILPFGLTTLVVQNLGEYERSLRSKLKFEIYLRDSSSPEQIQTLITQIKTIDGFVGFSFYDKEDVFSNMQNTLGTQLLPENSAKLQSEDRAARLEWFPSSGRSGAEPNLAG